MSSLYWVRSVLIAIVAAGVLLIVLAALIILLYRRLLREIAENRRTFLVALGSTPENPTPPSGGHRSGHLRSIPGGKATGVALVALVVWLRRYPPKLLAGGGVLLAAATVALVASLPYITGPNGPFRGGASSAEPPSGFTSTSTAHTPTSSNPAVLAAPPGSQQPEVIDQVGFNGTPQTTSAASTLPASSGDSTSPSAEPSPPDTSAPNPTVTTAPPTCVVNLALRPVLEVCLFG